MTLIEVTIVVLMIGRRDRRGVHERSVDEAECVSMQSRSAGIVFAARSASGTCYVIGDAANAAGTVFGSLGASSCDASTVPTIPTSVPTALQMSSGGGWAQAW